MVETNNLCPTCLQVKHPEGTKCELVDKICKVCKSQGGHSFILCPQLDGEQNQLNIFEEEYRAMYDPDEEDLDLLQEDQDEERLFTMMENTEQESEAAITEIDFSESMVRKNQASN